MNKALKAIRAMWDFASQMVEKHDMNGDDTMTDEEHKAWQDAAGLCSDALRENSLQVTSGGAAGNPSENVTLPAWAVNELFALANPAFKAIADEMGKAGHAASEQMQNEIKALDLAKEALKTAVCNAPTIEF